MPKKLAISVSGRKISEIAVSARNTSLVRCAIADSLVASRPSTTSLKFSSMSHARSDASMMSSK